MAERNKLSFKDISIEVNDIGAELKSLKKNDREYIWCSDPKYWRFCAPFLFPVVGKLKDLETYINDKLYKIPQHGIVRTRDFKLINKNDNTLEFVNTYNDETLELYPFKYELKVLYTIKENSLETKLTVKNLGDEVMPFNIGAHPAINVPLYQGDSFNDYTLYFEKEENILSPKVMENATLNFNEIVMNKPNINSLKLDKSLFDIDTIIITNVKSRSVELLNKDMKGIRFSFNNFSTLSIWTPKNEAPFLCLEPWMGYNDHYDTDKVFIHKDNIINLNKDEEYSCSYEIEFLD